MFEKFIVGKIYLHESFKSYGRIEYKVTQETSQGNFVIEWFSPREKKMRETLVRPSDRKYYIEVKPKHIRYVYVLKSRTSGIVYTRTLSETENNDQKRYVTEHVIARKRIEIEEGEGL